jgi:hypothetical protein
MNNSSELIGLLASWGIALGALVVLLFIMIGGFNYVTAGDDSDKAESGRKIIQNTVIALVAITFIFIILSVTGLIDAGVFKLPDNPRVFVNFLISLLFTIAIVISLIFLIWGGIRWILSGGDRMKVEDARITIISAIIGLIVTFASYFLFNLALSYVNLNL